VRKRAQQNSFIFFNLPESSHRHVQMKKLSDVWGGEWDGVAEKKGPGRGEGGEVPAPRRARGPGGCAQGTRLNIRVLIATSERRGRGVGRREKRKETRLRLSLSGGRIGSGVARREGNDCQNGGIEGSWQGRGGKGKARLSEG